MGGLTTKIGEFNEKFGVFNPDDPLGVSTAIGFEGPTSQIGDLTGDNAAAAAEEGAATQVAAAKEALALLRGDLDPFKQLGIRQIEGAQTLAADPLAQQALQAQTPGFSQFQQLSSDPLAQQALREATPGFSEFSNLATDPNAQLNFLQNNPLFASLQDQSRKDIFANQAARGKLSGSGTEELLQNRFLEQGNQLINQQLQRQSSALGTGQDILNQQLARQGGSISAGQDLINQQLNRQLPLLNIGQASAAQVGAGGVDLLTGAANAQSAGQIAAANAQAQGTQNVAAGAGALLALFSDKRLKSDLEKIGEHNGLNVYSWKWNKDANNLGLHGAAQGHIAQELQKTHPHLVGQDEDTGFFFVNYGTDETVDGDTWL